MYGAALPVKPDGSCDCTRPVGAAVSGLVLLLQALQLKGLLSSQQEQLLRLLAWQHDTRLLRAWDTVRDTGLWGFEVITMSGF